MSSADENLREAVLRALATDRSMSGLVLRVGVLNGVAHLGGEAPSEALWHRAETIAAGVAGVRGVVNRIQAPGAPNPLRTINLQLGQEPKGRE